MIPLFITNQQQQATSPRTTLRQHTPSRCHEFPIFFTNRPFTYWSFLQATRTKLHYTSLGQAKEYREHSGKTTRFFSSILNESSFLRILLARSYPPRGFGFFLFVWDWMGGWVAVLDG